MTFGFSGLGLLLLAAIFVVLSLARRQRLAAWLFLLGVGLFSLLVITVCFQISFPYERLGISIYSVFFAAAVFSFAGLVGLVARFVRHRIQLLL